MADKFPFLPDTKQRTFSIDLARFSADGDRAAVVVAEAGRFRLFWSRADGTWDSVGRAHNSLSQTPRRPDRTADLGWSRRIATVGANDQVVLVYKRRFGESSSRELWVDPFTFDVATEALTGGAGPRRVPRQGLGITRFGFSLWADAFDNRLLVVAQAFFTESFDTPRLVLLETPLPILDAETLESTAAWTLTELDDGGWDFDARREGDALAVLHRRTAASYAADVTLFDPAFAAAPVNLALSDGPNAVPRTLTQMAISSLTLVDVDLASTAVTSIDPGLPFGENPQLHRLSPFIATVERLEQGAITVGIARLRLRRFRSHGHLLMRTRLGWRTTRLFARHLNWPRYLSLFALVHEGIALQASVVGSFITFGLSWASLWSLRPTVLFKRDDTDKGMLLTFGHQDPDLGALRASTFRVFEDDGGDTLKAEQESFTLLDLGHRHVAGPVGDAAEPTEHRQLRPHEIDSGANHAASTETVTIGIRRVENSGNTLNGELTASVDRPASFYAYSEMGDGGPRVVFESGLELPPPTATIDEKVFQPEWVAEPPLPGRAWVHLSAPDFVDTELPGYFVAPTALNPQSLACDQQRALDGLAFVADSLRAEMPVPQDPLALAVPFDGDGLVRYREAPSLLTGGLVSAVSLTAASAVPLQAFAVTQAESFPPRPTVSASDQPFVIEIHQPSAMRFATDTLAFDGVVVGVPNPDDYQYDWTFSDGATDTGRHVEHQFGATRPDFSRPTPGDVLDDVEVALVVTAPDGTVSTATAGFRLPRSLWATLWTGYSAFRRAPDDILDDNGNWQISDAEWASYISPGMFVRDVTLAFFRYTMRYQVDDQGRGTRADVSNRAVHDSRFRFLGNPSGQGDVEYEVPVRVNMTGVRLTGEFGGGLGNLVVINQVDARLRCRQNFTIGVQTSERRDDFAEAETMRVITPGLPPTTTMIPSALCCLPVGALTVQVDEPVIDSGLTAGGWALGVLVPAAIAAAGSAAVLVVLAPLLLVAAPGLVGTLVISVIITALIGAGVGALATLLIDHFIVKPLIRQTIKDALEQPEVATSFRESGLFRYAGEGLAESLAIKLMQQAQRDGHGVADPLMGGRDRFRAPFFETIVVSEGKCKALLRV